MDPLKNFPHIYVVSHPERSDRRSNMERRLKHLGLYDGATFVKGGDVNSDLIKHYSADEPGPTACLIGHIRALREFYDTGEETACIIEDDVLFHDEFQTMVRKALENYPKVNLVQLYTISRAHQGPCAYGMFGTQGYLIRRKYAIVALNKYDRPTTYWPDGVHPTSEAITMYSGGIILSNPPAIIEDGLSYTLNPQSETNQHQRSCRNMAYRHGLEKYMNSDPEFTVSAESIIDLLGSNSWFRDSKVEDFILSRCQYQLEDIDFDDPNDLMLVVCLLHMYCGYYVDQDVGKEWAKKYKMLATSSSMNEALVKYKYLSDGIVEYYPDE